MSYFLYRGISVVDDEKNEGKIIPKGTKLHIEGQAGDPWVQCGEGIECGSSEGNAIIAHQFDSDKAKTAYISTSKNYDVAVKFATSGNLEKGYVYVLDASKFSEYGILYHERDIGSVANENEVTLRTENSTPIPEAVIAKKILVTPK